MLCSKKGCNKKIPSGEEVQIEGTIICKNALRNQLLTALLVLPKNRFTTMI